MNANKMFWEKRDFTQFAQTIRKSVEDLVASLGITKALTILDPGGSDGIPAIPEAKLGASVLVLT
jgi:hypothetical protein